MADEKSAYLLVFTAGWDGDIIIMEEAAIVEGAYRVANEEYDDLESFAVYRLPLDSPVGETERWSYTEVWRSDPA